DYQRAGLGRRLIKWLEVSALVAGISVVYLEVRANNRGAQTFYEKLGYRKIAHVPGYYSGRESALYMARDLECSTPARAK
ncbi:MAG: GNAT family N-acetyltransferase, partial [Burkholderiales bacterium]